MGPCASVNNKEESSPQKPSSHLSANSLHKQRSLKELNDLQSLNVYSINKFGSRVKLDKNITRPLQFQFQLSKFRCKMLQENNYYFLKVIFDEREFIAPIVSGSNPKFVFEECIFKELLPEDMEHHFMEIMLYKLPSTFDIYQFHKKEQLLMKATFYSGYKVDLITIILGPENHDIIFLDKKNKSSRLGRISYTIKCHHLENISLMIENAKITLNYLLQNELSLKLKYKNSKNAIETGYSKALHSNLINKEEKTLFEYTPVGAEINPLNFKTKTSMLDLRNADSILNMYTIRLIDCSGSGADAQAFLEQNPAFRTESNNDIKLVNHYSLIGFSTLNFYKILSENDDAILKQSSQFFRQVSGFKARNNNTSEAPDFVFQVFLKVSQLYTEQIFWNGNQIGTIELKINIDNIPLIRQIMCGVMTESGFEINSIHLYDNIITSKESNTLPEDLQLLAKQKVNLDTELVKLKQPSSQGEFHAGLLKILKEIKSTLSKSIEDNCLYYGYSSNGDLYTGQSLMLDIGLTLFTVEDKLLVEHRSISFEILKLINDRAEFDLGTLYTKWFIEKESIEEKYYDIRDNALLINKQIENFLEFNYLCLSFALDGISRVKTLDNQSKNFCEFFLSLAYFRLPTFRSIFIEAISSNVKKVFNASLMQSQKKESIEDFLETDPINNLILWDILFFNRLRSALAHIKEDNDIQEKMTKIIKLVTAKPESNRSDWRDKLIKRDFTFFNLIKTLDSFLLHKVNSQTINWLNIPGYDSILNALMHEVESREVKQFPKPLMDIIPLFTDNIAVINEFIRRIIVKTNVYDVNAVFNVVTIIDSIFNGNGNENEKNAQEQHLLKFDYNILSQAMKGVILIDHSLCVAKFLWLYYKNAHVMSLSHLGEICQSIFFLKFYSLFFHWSWQVRNIFYYFILYIIGFRIANVIPFKDMEDLKLIKNSSSQHKEFDGKIQESFGDILEQKMELISEIRSIVMKEHSDPSFNNILNPQKYAKVLKKLPPETHKSIVVSLHHFDTIDKEFTEWEKENKKKKDKEIDYPTIILVTPRDDVVEYSSE